MDLKKQFISIYDDTVKQVGVKQAEYIILKVLDKNISNPSSDFEKTSLIDVRKYFTSSYIQKNN